MSPYGRRSDDGRISGSTLRGTPNSASSSSSQAERLQVHQHGAAGIRDVGDVRATVDAARQVPDHPAVDRAEHGLATRCGLAHAFDVLEYPLQLGTGEVGGWRKSGALTNELPGGRAIQRADDPIGARVLPDDRVVPGPSGFRIPDDRRLALIGDADRRQIPRREAGVTERSCDHRVRALGNLEGIVFDPSGLRHDLFVLELVACDFVAAGVEHHESRARCALVECPDVVCHVCRPCRPRPLLNDAMRRAASSA